MFKNFEVLTTRQRISDTMERSAVKDFMSYVKSSLLREIGRAVAERMAEGDAGIIIPLGITRQKSRDDTYRGAETVTARALTKFIPKKDINPLIAGHLFDLLFDTPFIRVPMGYEVRHTHPRPFPSIFTDKVESAQLTFSEGRTELKPIYNDEHEMIGMAGKCEECGKIFYAQREEDDVW